MDRCSWCFCWRGMLPVLPAAFAPLSAVPLSAISARAGVTGAAIRTACGTAAATLAAYPPAAAGVTLGAASWA